MNLQRPFTASLLLFALVACSTAQQAPTAPADTSSAPGPYDAAATSATGAAAPSSAPGERIDSRPFPRQFTVNGTTFQVHQPQYESWRDDQVEGRFVMAVRTGTHTGPDGKPQDSLDYGVISFQARTQVDKAARAVVLTDIDLPTATFPTAVERQAEYLSLARSRMALNSTLTVSLDQLETAVAIATDDGRSVPSHTVSNTPPEIIFSTRPAVLVLVDGQPAQRETGSAGVERVINTASLLFRENGQYYLYLGDHWMTAPTLEGEWTEANLVSPGLSSAAAQVADLGREAGANPADSPLSEVFAKGQVPDVHVRQSAAELISVQGEPAFAKIAGTSLLYMTNTGADVFIDSADDQAWYVLVSGRWFTAPSSKGPWQWVAATALPADFSAIPPDSEKSAALASIPGTPEAKESLIANSIPQTAVVNRHQVSLSVRYDGAPSFEAIEGTTLNYARNTAVPVIQVDDTSYYAVDKGVWFYAQSPTGPWVVAGHVPAVIYTIPAESPLHYVTYVRIYGGHGDEVYVGYTPGYYGTVVSDGVVVYGTGYGCDPWIGADWYGCPATYGMGVYFGWNPWVGWSFGMGWGWYAGWYGPYGPWWGPWYGPWYPWGWWGGGAAAWNVYGHWGNAAVRGTAAAWANPWTGNYGRAGRGGYYNEQTGGRGIGRAGINTNVYTGTTVAGAQGVRYNPETGRVVGGSGAVAGNPYSDRAAAGGQRTVVNTDAGRVTRSAGGAVAGESGVAGGGAFRSEGAGGNSASGVGGFHYNADTGTFHHSGVYNFNDQYFAGHDGNVYHYDNGEWQSVDRPEQRSANGMPSNLDRDRQARERANTRINGGYQRPAGTQRPDTGYNRPIGGMRGGLGGRPMGGGFRRR